MNRKLENKVAVVTGASKGIGASIARHLAAEGASVIVNYASSKAGADKVVADIIAAGGKAFAVGANVALESDAAKLFDETSKRFGRLDILVNNAGVYAFASIEGVTPEHFHSHFDTNVLCVLLTTRAALALFPPSGGSIVNISSAISNLTPPMASVYVGTKRAVDGITKSLAKELAPRGIRVNAINPGLIMTEGVHSAGIADSDFERQLVAITPLGRAGQPEEVALPAVFLASDDARYITGETLYVSGGAAM